MRRCRAWTVLALDRIYPGRRYPDLPCRIRIYPERQVSEMARTKRKINPLHQLDKAQETARTEQRIYHAAGYARLSLEGRPLLTTPSKAFEHGVARE